MPEVINNEACHQQPAHQRLTDEDRAWAMLYSSITEVAAAEVVIEQLDAAPRLRQAHLGLYLRARVTLQQQRNQASAAQRRQEAVARVGTGTTTGQTAKSMVYSALRVLRCALATFLGVAVEALPEVRGPAKAA
jgi:hypothetical protein